MSSELEGPPDELADRGALGRTTIRAYGAVVPEGWGSDFGDRPGWGTGIGLSHGIARAVQVSLGFAYHRVNIIGGDNWDALRQVTASLELIPSAKTLVRPWLGVGLGYYDQEIYSIPVFSTEKGDRSAFVTHQGTLGVNLGAGIALRISRSINVEAGGRFHQSVTDPPPSDVELLSVQVGLSYVAR